jgi:phytoene synthase
MRSAAKWMMSRMTNLCPVDERRAKLAAWREDVRRACQRAAGLQPAEVSAGNAANPSVARATAGTQVHQLQAGGALEPQFVVIRELEAVIRQYPALHFGLFDDLIRGVEMDLDIKRYPDFEMLEEYCYRVASVVGLMSIEIFGYSNPRTRDYAVHLGKALQLTNILRDVRTDAERGRIYFPSDELARFGVREAEILNGKYSARFRDLAASLAARAKHFYSLARETLPAEDRRAMAAAELMGSVYWRLLQKLEAREFNVFSPSVTRVSRGQKILLILRTWFRVFSGAVVPNYGTP